MYIAIALSGFVAVIMCWGFILSSDEKRYNLEARNKQDMEQQKVLSRQFKAAKQSLFRH